MHEVFYFTHSELEAADIIVTSNELGLQALEFTGEEAYIKIYRGDSNNTGTYFKWFDITNDNTIAYDEVDLAVLEEYNPNFRGMISFHFSNFSFVRDFLKSIIIRYGGWAGCDDNWQRKYYEDNIDEMNCF